MEQDKNQPINSQEIKRVEPRGREETHGEISHMKAGGWNHIHTDPIKCLDDRCAKVVMSYCSDQSHTRGEGHVFTREGAG